MPSFTSRTVPTSRTSISARSAVWISRRRISLSSPGRRMESLAIGFGWEIVKNITYFRTGEDGEGRRRSEQDGEGVNLLRPPPSSSDLPRPLFTRPRPSSYKARHHTSEPDGTQLRGRSPRHPPRRPHLMAGGPLPHGPHRAAHGGAW